MRLQSKRQDAGGNACLFNAVRGLALAAPMVLAAAPTALADDDRRGADRVSARLSGFNEVHFIAGPPPALRGAVSTKASGSFKAKINDLTDTIEYELSYAGVESAVTQAHIHFGQRHTAGGIVVWLCQSATNPAPATVAAATPLCPQEGTVTGVIMPAQVLAVTGQGIDVGEFEKLKRAIRAGVTYANVHSTVFAPGEIRGQIHDHDNRR